MLEIFFPLSGLHFSRLCIFLKNKCHLFVIEFQRNFCGENSLFSNQFFYHIFTPVFIQGFKFFV
jgi:hypothetical protein